MKKYILAALLLATTTLTHATIAPANAPLFGGMPGELERTQLTLDELPPAVRKTLDGASFTGWKPNEAFFVKAKDRIYYEVTFVNGEENEILKLNEEGGKIE